MLTLAQQQESLRAIVLGRPIDTSGDLWLTEITASRGLQLMRATVSWWQRFQIELQCRYTSRLLKRCGCFEESVHACFSTRSAPASIEELASAFLTSLQAHTSALVRAVAAFELACLAPPAAGSIPVAIHWDRNPVDVILALDSSSELPSPEPETRYSLYIGADIPGGMSCVREAQPA
jgi:hypothetical protein